MRWSSAIYAASVTLVSYIYFYVYQVVPEPNACDMTVMYRNMFFIKIKVTIPKITDAERLKNPALNYAFSTDFSSYYTILYGEGHYGNYALQSKTVSGIPVLFIPGNVGSARQVRSLGSVLQNKTESRFTSFSFNVFAVDFNEEFSGIGGMYLDRQARYLKHVVNHIWSMYESPSAGIIVVAHSMGGIVVRSLLGDPSFDSKKISLIITLGTPHKLPPIMFDSYMEDIYIKMRRSWKQRYRKSMPLISIFGGLKDTLVSEHLSVEPGIQHFFTAGIDSVEAETDHLCIVWCNQLVRHTSRLLFEYAKAPEKFSENFRTIVKRFYKSNGNVYEKPDKLENSSKPILIDNGRLTVVRNRNNYSEQALIKVANDTDTAVFVTFSKGSSWLFNNKQMHYANGYRHFQYAYLPTVAAPNHFSIILAPHHVLKAVIVNQESAKKQTVTVDLISLLRTFPSPLWSSNISGKQLVAVVPLKIFYTWFALKAELQVINCKGSSSNDNSKIEFTSKDIRRISRRINGAETIIGYKLYSDSKYSNNSSDGQFMFILNTKCSYRASIQLDFVKSIKLIFQQHAYVIGFYISLYLLSSLFAILCCDDLKLSKVWCYILKSCVYVTLAAIIKCDNFFIVLSLILFNFFLEIFSQMYTILISAELYLVKTRLVAHITHDYLTIGLLAVMMLLNHFSNGFIPLTVLLAVNFVDFMKFVNRSKKEKLDSCSAITYICLLHLFVFILFLPFGFCSVWNLLHYGIAQTYQDPTRVPVYICTVLVLISRISPNFYRNYKLEYTVLLALFAKAIINSQALLCLSRLGTYLAVTLVILTNLYSKGSNKLSVPQQTSVQN